MTADLRQFLNSNSKQVQTIHLFSVALFGTFAEYLTLNLNKQGVIISYKSVLNLADVEYSYYVQKIHCTKNLPCRDISQPRNQISCKPCLRDTITAEATKRCRTCKDPEPLCDVCAKRHTLMEANKGHQMTADLQQFFSPHSE